MKTILSILALSIVQTFAQISGVFSAGIHRGYRLPIPPETVYTEIFPPTVSGSGFDEGSGTTFASSFGPGFSASGPMNWVTGASGSGFAIGTTGDETATTTAPVTFGVNKITVCAWIKCANWSAFPGVIVQTTS